MSKIDLYNMNNSEFCIDCGDKYNFIYADCIYESTDLWWLRWAVQLLEDDGIFIVQTDYHTAADYVNHLKYTQGWDLINWCIYVNDWGGVPKKGFPRKHDDILIFSNSKNYKWYPERIQIPKATAGTIFDKKGTGMKTPPDVFYDHVSFSTVSSERIKIDGKCIQWQKPLWLMRRLLLPFTDEEDNVLDLFMGTGTLGAVAKESNRNYTGIEIDPEIFKIAEERLS